MCLLVTWLLVTSFTAAFAAPRAGSSIVGGEDAPEGAWPWMAYLVATDGLLAWSCDGTILTDEWILTAAHCVVNDPLLKFTYVRLGTHSLVGPSVFHRGIAKFVVHPEYTEFFTPINDIALMKLEQKILFSHLVQPVHLPTPEDVFDSNTECWATGWGTISEGVPLSNISAAMTLQQVQVSLINHSTCKEVFPELSPQTICAGTVEGGAGVCHGDSGGPLVCRAKRGFVQTGIVSYGMHCGAEAVYTRVKCFEDFISETIDFDS